MRSRFVEVASRSFEAACAEYLKWSSKPGFARCKVSWRVLRFAQTQSVVEEDCPCELLPAGVIGLVMPALTANPHRCLFPPPLACCARWCAQQEPRLRLSPINAMKAN